MRSVRMLRRTVGIAQQVGVKPVHRRGSDRVEILDDRRNPAQFVRLAAYADQPHIAGRPQLPLRKQQRDFLRGIRHDDIRLLIIKPRQNPSDVICSGRNG